MTTRRSEVGDGDLCPVEPTHGRMLALKNQYPPTQYCPHITHDGVWGKAGRTGPTRKVWPLGHISFEKAVEDYSRGTVVVLPELNIDLEV